MDLYEILGVDPDADEAAIKAAYRRAAGKTHPDRKGGCVEGFKQVQLAYDVLSDSRRRNTYDKTGAVEDEKVAEAELLLLIVFKELIADPAFNGDFVLSARIKIQDLIDKFAVIADGIDAEIRRLERISNRVKTNDGEKNLFEMLIKGQLDANRANREKGDQEVVKMHAAMQMLDSYMDVEAFLASMAAACMLPKKFMPTWPFGAASKL